MRGEIGSLLIAGITPVLGVLFWGWSAHEVMFLLSWEVITTSAVLMWLFNYPERSTLSGLFLAIVCLPAGLMMWVLLDMDYEDARYIGTVAHFARETWVAVVLITIYAIVGCRNAMAEARRRGASISSNNRILLKWLYSVFLPFFVFASLLAGWKTISPPLLASVLVIKLLIDLAVTRWEYAKTHGAAATRSLTESASRGNAE